MISSFLWMASLGVSTYGGWPNGPRSYTVAGRREAAFWSNPIPHPAPRPSSPSGNRAPGAHRVLGDTPASRRPKTDPGLAISQGSGYRATLRPQSACCTKQLFAEDVQGAPSRRDTWPKGVEQAGTDTAHAFPWMERESVGKGGARGAGRYHGHSASWCMLKQERGASRQIAAFGQRISQIRNK